MRIIERQGMKLISYRDIQASPDGEAFTQWSLLKTMALIDGEPWVYWHDWQRYQRWKSQSRPH